MTYNVFGGTLNLAQLNSTRQIQLFPNPGPSHTVIVRYKVVMFHIYIYYPIYYYYYKRVFRGTCPMGTHRHVLRHLV